MLNVLLASNAVTMNRNSEDKSLVLVLMGPPGSGKGTHACSLSTHLNLPHISTGDLFREHIRTKTSLGLLAKSYIDQGHLVPDELVLDMLFDRVSQPDCKKGYILDGFPRTVPQAKELDQRLSNKHQLITLNFNLSDEKIIERVAGRIACKRCGRPYHKTFDPPKNEFLCDCCGGAIHQRDDDREEIIRKRLEVYRTQTEPLIAYYAKQKEVLREIDSQNSKEQVFQDVLEALTSPLALR